MTDFALTDADKQQGLWLRMKDHFFDRLALARVRNDRSLTEQETAEVRGEIKALKALIALGDDRPIVTGDDDAP